MKRILIFLAAAVSLFSCTKFEKPSPTAPEAVPSVKVSIDSFADSTFTFTVTPDKGTGYYSYTVLEGEEMPLDSMSVFKVEYKGISEATMSAADFPSVTIEVTAEHGILPNTTYTVYAVAANSQSLVSSVKAATVTTADSNSLIITDYTPDSESASVIVEFNSPIFRGKEEAKVMAHYYGVWNPDEALIDVEVPAANIVIEDNTLFLTAPDTICGAYVFFTWDKGFVKSAVDSLCPAYDTHIFKAQDGKITKGTVGIYSRWPVTSFGWTRVAADAAGQYVKVKEDSVIAFTALYDTTSAGEVVPAFEYALKADSMLVTEALEDISVTYKNAKKKTSYPSCDYGFGGTLVKLFCSGEKPDKGDYLKYSIEEGTFEDVWGNYSEAYENEKDNFLYSYGYSVDDFCGTFALTQQSYRADWKSYVDTIVITELGVDSVQLSGFGKYNPYFESYFTPVSKPIKGVIDGVFGLLTISSEEVIGTVNGNDVVMASVFDDDDNPLYLQFQMPEKGKYVVPEIYTYFYFGNYWDVAYFNQMTYPTSNATYTVARIQSTSDKSSIPNVNRNLKHLRE